MEGTVIHEEMAMWPTGAGAGAEGGLASGRALALVALGSLGVVVMVALYMLRKSKVRRQKETLARQPVRFRVPKTDPGVIPRGRKEYEFGREPSFNPRLDVEMTEVHTDSRVRDRTAYPNPSVYRVELDRVYTNVVGVMVSKAVIPKTGYVLNEHNNVLNLDVSGYGEYSVTLAIGNYTAATFATALNAGFLATLPEGVSGVVTFSDDRLDRLRLTFSTATKLKFGTGSVIFETMGWPGEDTAYALVHTSPNRVNFGGPGYIDVHSQLDKVTGGRLARILITDYLTAYVDDYVHERMFHPLAKLSHLDLRFTWSDGRGEEHLYDFNNVDLNISFRIFTLSPITVSEILGNPLKEKRTAASLLPVGTERLDAGAGVLA